MDKRKYINSNYLFLNHIYQKCIVYLVFWHYPLLKFKTKDH